MVVRVWDLAFAHTPVTTGPPKPLPQMHAEFVEVNNEWSVFGVLLPHGSF